MPRWPKQPSPEPTPSRDLPVWCSPDLIVKAPSNLAICGTDPRNLETGGPNSERRCQKYRQGSTVYEMPRVFPKGGRTGNAAGDRRPELTGAGGAIAGAGPSIRSRVG